MAYRPQLVAAGTPVDDVYSEMGAMTEEPESDTSSVWMSEILVCVQFPYMMVRIMGTPVMTEPPWNVMASTPLTCDWSP